MGNHFTLITVRTIAQADGLHKGAGSAAHEEATSFVQICQEDMTRLNIEEGELVRVRSDAGQVVVTVCIEDIPSGLLFIPMGPTANELVGTETFGIGMPSFKGQRVELEKYEYNN